MKKIFKILLLLSFISTISYGKDIDINKVLEEAKIKDKQVMFFFHIPRCPYCERMLKKNFKDENILAIIKKYFLLVDIYTADEKKVVFNDFKGTPKEFAKHIGASAYPATLFMNKDGKIIHKAIGYRNIGEYSDELKYIGTKSYKKIDLDTFIMNMELEEDD